jgi:signal transduction histidine kinase
VAPVRGASLTLRAPALLLLVALAGPARATPPAPPKRIVSIHSFERGVPVEAQFTAGLRAALPLGSDLELHSEHLDRIRFPDPGYRDGFRAWLLTKYALAPPDLVLAVGVDALSFLTAPETPFPGVPVVFGMVPEGTYSTERLPPQVTGVIEHIGIAETLDLAMTLFPGTGRVVLVGGASEQDRPLNELLRREVAAAGRPVEVVQLFGLPMGEIQARLRAQPPGTVVLVLTLLQDGAGRKWIGPQLVPALVSASPAPVFGFWSHFLGLGTVGGVVTDFQDSGASVAKIALRLLAGERVEDIPVVRALPSRTVLDARQLERFGVPDARVPAGVRVLLRDPSAWDEYRGMILVAAAALLLQSALIALLLVERRRRARAEAKAREDHILMARMNRLSALGELVVSLAHEINSPLGAVLNNAEAAQRYLGPVGKDDAEVRACLEDIARDATRAGEVLRRIRGVLRRDAKEPVLVDVEAVLRDALDLVRPDAKERGIAVDLAVAPGLPLVRGDDVQLVQVLLNLLVNALDAVSGATEPLRLVRLLAVLRGEEVAIRVEDGGPGVPAADVEKVFEPFFTTKASGLGMGLAISRSIVEAHHGTLSVGKAAIGGAAFEIRLPVARGSGSVGRSATQG